MAAAGDDKTGTGNTAVERTHFHDEVALLSVRSDGTPDQIEPELIGDKEATKEATRRQFVEQAVSATDDQVRRELAATSTNVSTKPDPTVKRLEDAHEKAAKAGEAAADKAVEAQHE